MKDYAGDDMMDAWNYMLSSVQNKLLEYFYERIVHKALTLQIPDGDFEVKTHGNIINIIVKVPQCLEFLPITINLDQGSGIYTAPNKPQYIKLEMIGGSSIADASSEDLDKLASLCGIEKHHAASAGVDCNHNWADYVGMRECFKYCTKCDKKQS